MNLESFNFYFDFAFTNKHKSILFDFIGDSDLKNDGYWYIEEGDYYVKEEILEDGDPPLLKMTSITREGFLNYKFEKHKKLFIDEIREKLYNLDSLAKNSFLSELLNDFYRVNKKLLTLDFPYKYEVMTKIDEVKTDLKLITEEIVKNHKAFSKLESLEIVNYGTYFGLKPSLKKSFLIDLYDVCIDLFLVDDVEVSENDFIEVFTAAKPDPEMRIIFKEKNYGIVYFLEAIQPFFDNFTFTSIEQSKNFYNKQNKLLTATDLSSAKSRMKNSVESIANKIDIAVTSLKSQHLR